MVISFKHIDTLSTFNSTKFSADSTDSTYYLGDSTTPLQGTPTVKYTDICLSKANNVFYSHGTFYSVNVLSLNYDSATTTLQLKRGNTVINSLDATPFIKDGMLDSVELVKVAEQGVTVQVPYLKFTFNTVKSSVSGTATPAHSIIRTSLEDLVNIYNGGNILLTSEYAMASTYSVPAIGDSVDVAVGKLTKGVKDATDALLWNEYNA